MQYWVIVFSDGLEMLMPAAGPTLQFTQRIGFDVAVVPVEINPAHIAANIGVDHDPIAEFRMAHMVADLDRAFRLVRSPAQAQIILIGQRSAIFVQLIDQLAQAIVECVIIAWIVVERV